MANDKDLLGFIASYDCKNVTTLAGLKNDILGAFIIAKKGDKNNYNLLQDKDLENVQLPANAIDGLLFRLPSHQIKIQDKKENSPDNIVMTNRQKTQFEPELNELKKLYDNDNVSSAGALYFMAACSKESLTIKQQNEILNLCSQKEDKNIIKPAKKATLSR